MLVVLFPTDKALCTKSSIFRVLRLTRMVQEDAHLYMRGKLSEASQNVSGQRLSVPA